MASIREDVEKLEFVQYWWECRMARLLQNPVSRSSESVQSCCVTCHPVPGAHPEGRQAGGRTGTGHTRSRQHFSQKVHMSKWPPGWTEKLDACMQWNSVQSHKLENRMRKISHSQKQQKWYYMWDQIQQKHTTWTEGRLSSAEKPHASEWEGTRPLRHSLFPNQPTHLIGLYSFNLPNWLLNSTGRICLWGTNIMF